MTTDMSERVRMRRFANQRAISRSYMNLARKHSIVKQGDWQKNVPYFIQQAREANRQAVRIWYGRTTRL